MTAHLHRAHRICVQHRGMTISFLLSDRHTLMAFVCEGASIANLQTINSTRLPVMLFASISAGDVTPESQQLIFTLHITSHKDTLPTVTVHASQPGKAVMKMGK